MLHLISGRLPAKDGHSYAHWPIKYGLFWFCCLGSWPPFWSSCLTMATLAQLHDCHSCNDERNIVPKKTLLFKHFCFFRMMCLWAQLYRYARLPNFPRYCFGCSMKNCWITFTQKNQARTNNQEGKSIEREEPWRERKRHYQWRERPWTCSNSRPA